MKGASNTAALLVALASFYAGKPVTVSDGDRNTTGVAGSSTIMIDPQVRASIEKMMADVKRGKPVDVYGLGTLIHEAIHTRWPDNHDPNTGAGTRDPKTGFFSGDDEWQARQLGFNLVPDAMQRFFGIAPESAAGKQALAAAESRALSPHFGSPAPGQLPGPRVFWMNPREGKP